MASLSDWVHASWMSPTIAIRTELPPWDGPGGRSYLSSTMEEPVIAWLLVVGWALAADIRGMTVSTPTWGWEWGSDAMASSLTVLDEHGVNWVSIHPYARIRGDGTVSARPIDPENPPDWLVRPIHEAHARGMKVMIKPHLAYWGSPFSWRGAIAFPDPEARERFFTSYQAWMTSLAQAAAAADALCVGTELDQLVDYEQPWRKVIAEVRQVYAGPLTYAANWDQVHRVPFWDALDVIGVQAYFPILEEPPAEVPTEAALAEGWARVMKDLRGLSEKHGRHIVFTELGYDAAAHAPVKPWQGGRGALGQAMQQACTRAALRAIDSEPAVIGAFLWKWFPGELQSGDFRMSSPPMRSLIRELWAP